MKSKYMVRRSFASGKWTVLSIAGTDHSPQDPRVTENPDFFIHLQLLSLLLKGTVIHGSLFWRFDAALFLSIFQETFWSWVCESRAVTCATLSTLAGVTSQEDAKGPAREKLRKHELAHRGNEHLSDSITKVTELDGRTCLTFLSCAIIHPFCIAEVSS